MPEYPEEPRVIKLFDGLRIDEWGMFQVLLAGGNQYKMRPVLDAIKIQYNLLNPGVQKFVLSLVSAGLVWWVHLGTPCTAWSKARHNIRNMQKAREAVGTLFTCRIIRECLFLLWKIPGAAGSGSLRL